MHQHRRAARAGGDASPRRSARPVAESKHKTIRNAIDVANAVVGMLHELRQKLNNRLTGSGTAVGDPRHPRRGGDPARWAGRRLQRRLPGDESDHTLDTNGYRTSFEVQKEIIP